MKVIFLDIDGVLVTGNYVRKLRDNEADTHKGIKQWKENKYRSPMPWTAFDPECVKELNRIIEVTDAKVVISSIWRSRGVPEMRDILKTEGVDCEVIGTTPHRYMIDRKLLYETKGRGNEIAAWLHVNGEEVENFVILDDDSDMVYLSSHLVQTGAQDGLTGFEADIAIDILSNSASKAA